MAALSDVPAYGSPHGGLLTSGFDNNEKLLPGETIVRWLAELGGADSAHAAPLRFSEAVSSGLMSAISAFGPDAPAVLWLASLAVITIRPASGESGAAVRIARASLRKLLADSAMLKASFDHGVEALEAPKESSLAQAAATEGLPQHPTAFAQPSGRCIYEERSTPETLRDELCFGEPTSGAGLYFLVNALRYLQIQESHFSLLFLARLFLRIADHCNVETGDPVLRWAEVTAEQCEPEQIADRLLRIWMLKVRRWCWRNGRISMRDVVRRSGYVTLTRTDLDVTLAIESADVRIRRVGLDLDPGWVPWFGCVVRFHYRSQGELRG